MTEVPHEATLSRRGEGASLTAKPCAVARRSVALSCGEAGAVVRSALLAYGAVYAFAQQVGVAVVARVLLDHVVQHPAQ